MWIFVNTNRSDCVCCMRHDAIKNKCTHTLTDTHRHTHTTSGRKSEFVCLLKRINVVDIDIKQQKTDVYTKKRTHTQPSLNGMVLKNEMHEMKVF